MFLFGSFLGLFLRISCLEDYTPSPEHAVELINFLDLLNNRDNGNQYDNRKKSRYLEESSQNNNKMQDLMQVLQKNYYDDQDDNNAYRLHYISNPEVIEEYKANLDKKRWSPELDIDEEEEKTLKEILQVLRRNAVFRLNKREDSVGNAVALRIGNKIGQSLENIEDKPKYKEYSDKETHFLKKDTGFNAARDTITKKYNWAESLEFVKKDRKKMRQKRIEMVDRNKPKMKYKPRKIIQESLPYKNIKKDSMSYGRTSVPYVGKMGIYEDK